MTIKREVIAEGRPAVSRLDDIKARLAATPMAEGEVTIAGRRTGGTCYTLGDKAEFLRQCLNDDENPLYLVEDTAGETIYAVTGDGPEGENRAELIAHAPADLAALVAVVEGVQRVRDLMRAEEGRGEYPERVFVQLDKALQPVTGEVQQ
ncbi:MAG: hypothetical protein ABS888_00115 [Eubacteriales bacterium]